MIDFLSADLLPYRQIQILEGRIDTDNWFAIEIMIISFPIYGSMEHELDLFILSEWFSLENKWLIGSFGLDGFLCHINHCRLFNAKSSLYIYIKYIRFGFVSFYGISTIVGYLMQNPLYTYILNIYDLVWFGFMAYQPLKVI